MKIYISIEAATKEELEQVRRILSDGFNSTLHAETLPLENYRYGVDTYLDSDNTYTYFVYRISEKTGVYFFFDDKEQLIYVGSAKNLQKRIPKSYRERNGCRCIKYIGYEYTVSEDQARIFESAMIQKYKPKLNKIIPYTKAGQWKFFEVDGLGIECVKRSNR